VRTLVRGDVAVLPAAQAVAQVGHGPGRGEHRAFSATRLCWSIGIGGISMTS
jgi:hypothetical protein